MHWDQRPKGFAGPSRQARLFDPWTWCRDGYAGTAAALVIRHGRWLRRVEIVPYGHIQALALKQGWWERRRRLTSIRIHSIPGPVVSALWHLDTDDAAALMAWLTPRIWFPPTRRPVG
jgi:putative membrane protein